MVYKGYRIRVRCIDWEQIDKLGRYWDTIALKIDRENLVGLGMSWSKDDLYFDYALGVIDDEATLDKLKIIDLSDTEFDPKYVEILLPDLEEWKAFKGRSEDLERIYKEEVDCCRKSYDYELEYFDSKGNVELKIHYIDS